MKANSNVLRTVIGNVHVEGRTFGPILKWRTIWDVNSHDHEDPGRLDFVPDRGSIDEEYSILRHVLGQWAGIQQLSDRIPKMIRNAGGNKTTDTLVCIADERWACFASPNSSHGYVYITIVGRELDMIPRYMVTIPTLHGGAYILDKDGIVLVEMLDENHVANMLECLGPDGFRDDIPIENGDGILPPSLFVDEKNVFDLDIDWLSVGKTYPLMGWEILPGHDVTLGSLIGEARTFSNDKAHEMVLKAAQS